MSQLPPVSDGHGRPDAGVALLHEVDLGPVLLLDLPLEDLVPDQTGPGPHYPPDPALPEHVRGHHAGQVGHHAPAHRPRHLAQAEVALVDVGHAPLLVGTVPLSEYEREGDEAGHLRLLHPGGQGGGPDPLLRDAAAELHAPELDHPDEGGQGVPAVQRGGHRDVPALALDS